MNIKLLYLLLFLFGFCSSCEILCFAVSSENTPNHLVATASAFTNFLIMLGGFASQPLIGMLLDATWAGQISNNIRVYSGTSYQLSFAILPAAFLLGFVLTFWLKETGNKTEKH